MNLINSEAKKYYNKGFEYFKKGQAKKAIELYLKAIAVEPDFIEAYVNLGAAHQKAQNPKEALKIYKKAAKINSKLPIIYFNLASLYQETKPSLTAYYYEKVIKLDPSDWDTLNRLGLIYKKLDKFDKAIHCYQKAISLNPKIENAYFNLGVVKSHLGIISRSPQVLKEAARFFRKTLELNPASAETLNNLALVLQNLDKDAPAEKYYQKAIKINPRMPEIYFNFGHLNEKMERIEETIRCYKKVIEIAPDFPDILGIYSFILKQVCDWKEYKKYELLLNKETAEKLKAGQKPSEIAFFNAVRTANPKLNSRVARAWTKFLTDRYRKLNPPLFTNQLKTRFLRKKIRVGYASDGFRDFPTTHNITGVLQNHDKSQFEIFVYSYGKNDKSKYRKKIISCAEVFRDIKNLSLSQMAEIVYKDKIDILVDLKGHTRGSRFEFLWSRPAPVQIGWLGFVGTTSTDFIDYFIADKTVLPKANAKYFSEKIIYLPDCYWPTDNKLQISREKPQRKDFNLPENAFIFASFNHPYKIEPELFRVWMNILKRVPNAIIWQWSSNKVFEKNILREAKKSQVDKKRIIFAKSLPKEDHLSRLKLADLSLDTTVCNGHTTTTDSLWAGVAVITTKGTHFASRVSASMLTAIGMEEMIAKNLKDYENLAVSLATNRQKLKVISQKLKVNKDKTPLFDTQRFTKNLEKSYKTVWQNYVRRTLKRA